MRFKRRSEKIFSYCLLILIVNSCTSNFNDKNSTNVNYILYDGTFEDLKNQSYSLLEGEKKITFNKESRDSTLFILSNKNSSVFIVRSESFLLPLKNGIPIKNKEDKVKIINFLKRFYTCKCTKKKRKERLNKIIWQLENGVLSQGHTF